MAPLWSVGAVPHPVDLIGPPSFLAPPSFTPPEEPPLEELLLDDPPPEEPLPLDEDPELEDDAPLEETEASPDEPAPDEPAPEEPPEELPLLEEELPLEDPDCETPPLLPDDDPAPLLEELVEASTEPSGPAAFESDGAAPVPQASKTSAAGTANTGRSPCVAAAANFAVILELRTSLGGG